MTMKAEDRLSTVGRKSTPWSMDTSRWPQSDVKFMAEEIARLGLSVNVAELDMFGYTIVHADKLGAQDLIRSALEAVFTLVEERSGVRPDVVSGSTHAGLYGMSMSKFLHRDRSFQKLMMHPIALALVTYLLGQRCLFSLSSLFMKGPAEGHVNTDKKVSFANRGERLQLGVHVDYTQHPAPFSAMVEQCNTTWLLSDYTAENGSIAMVPGSHRMRRHPADNELEEFAVPIEAPMGSLLVFNSATWHGSFPRKVPGLRTGLAFFFCRAYMRTLESHHDVVTPELLAGMPPRFATLMGVDKFEYNEQGVPKEYAQLWSPRPTTWA
jgi:ectoine hydroxylase-related dioxygenase (phytanoyl-CoA dioxygenase family)